MFLFVLCLFVIGLLEVRFGILPYHRVHKASVARHMEEIFGEGAPEYGMVKAWQTVPDFFGDCTIMIRIDCSVAPWKPLALSTLPLEESVGDPGGSLGITKPHWWDFRVSENAKRGYWSTGKTVTPNRVTERRHEGK